MGSAGGARQGGFALTLVFFAVIALEGQAHAGEILAESGVFIGDTTAQYSLNVSGPGSLTVYLNDYKWPTPVADLTLEIASQGKILGQLKGSGEETVTLTGPGTYYAYIMGNATGALDVGAYGVTADFQAAAPPPPPVPLPGGFTLLLGGVAAALWWVRRKAPSVSSTMNSETVMYVK